MLSDCSFFLFLWLLCLGGILYAKIGYLFLAFKFIIST